MQQYANPKKQNLIYIKCKQNIDPNEIKKQKNIDHDKHNRWKSFYFHFKTIVILAKTLKGDIKRYGQNF